MVAVEIMLSVSFWAVPAFILELPVTNSGPTTTTTGKSATAAIGESGLQVMQPVAMPFCWQVFMPLTTYGVVPGWCWARDDDENGESTGVYIWTQRGLCKAMPFVNLTSGHVSVAPGIQAGAAVIAQGGQRRFVACLHAGGEAFNAR